MLVVLVVLVVVVMLLDSIGARLLLALGFSDMYWASHLRSHF